MNAIEKSFVNLIEGNKLSFSRLKKFIAYQFDIDIYWIFIIIITSGVFDLVLLYADGYTSRWLTPILQGVHR